jgi:hypothetical protein
MIGTLRTDLRRVEFTIGARFDVRFAASDALLRDEVERQSRDLRAETARLREEILQQLVDARAEIRAHLTLISTLCAEIRAIADGLGAFHSSVESVPPHRE